MTNAINTVYDTAMEIALISLGDIDGLTPDELEYKAVERAIRFVPMLDLDSDANQSVRYVSMCENIERVFIDDVRYDDKLGDIIEYTAHDGKKTALPICDTTSVLGQAVMRQAKANKAREVLVTIGSAPAYSFTSEFLAGHAHKAVWIDSL